MRILSLEERMDHVPTADYVRAYSLLVGEERAKEIVDDMIANLTANPDDHMVLAPQFIALLALFSTAGRALAAALLKPEEQLQHQRDLARQHPRVLEEFPHLAELLP